MLFIVLLAFMIHGCSFLVNGSDLFLPRSASSWFSYKEKEEMGSRRLVLTPYIETGMFQKARSLAAVNYSPFSAEIPSYSGFFTVNKRFNSNLFFWFFPAEHDYESAPVLLWMQGGPGTSSLFGLFNEVGPFSVADDNITIVLNPYSWHKNHSLLFVDNPVGTGFSYTNFEAGYATNQTQIGEEMYCALVQFFLLFSELRNLPFFITGESYAGKYVPAVSYAIHKNNPTAEIKINLEGLAVGNGWTDPENMMEMSSFVYQLGLVDNNIREKMKEVEDGIVRAIQRGEFKKAYDMTGNVYKLLHTNAAFENVYNFLYDKIEDMASKHSIFVQRSDVRKALHVGDAEYSNQDYSVYIKLVPDSMQTVRPWLEELLEHYRVLYYSGQLDIIVAYPLSVNMYNKLQFRAAEEYRNATRVPWYVDGQLAGYMKSGGKFTEVLVRNAGHFVPTDQPEWALDLITKFTRDRFVYRNFIPRIYVKGTPWTPWLK